MDKLAEYALGQAPALVVLVYLVILFLRHLAHRDDFVKRLGDDCHQVQRDAIKTIAENTKLLAEVCTLLKHLNGKRK